MILWKWKGKQSITSVQQCLTPVFDVSLWFINCACILGKTRETSFFYHFLQESPILWSEQFAQISQIYLWILQKHTTLHYNHRGQLWLRCEVSLVIWRSTVLSLILWCSSARYWIPKLQPSSVYECGHLAILHDVLMTPQVTTSTSLWRWRTFIM